jgi:hypothetical protein
MRVDLAHMSRQELARTVAERCSRFGAVSQVAIMLDSEHPFALAGVVMRERAEALALLRGMGGSMIQNTVLIRLEQV